MRCPHSLTGSPDRCSQCIGAQPRIVTQDGSLVLVDGEPPRPIAPDIEGYVQQPRAQRRNRGRK